MERERKEKMAFVREYKNIEEELAEWEYLTKIGVRNMYNKPLKKWATSLVVDRDNNYFLIPQGQTNLNRDYVEIHYYALCLDGIVLNMEVTRRASGRARDYSFECHWTVEKIRFPKEWSNCSIENSELVEIIREAFVAETYSKRFTPERVKEITVDVNI